jgi:hypothetical protein
VTERDDENRIVYEVRFDERADLELFDFRSVEVYKTGDDLGDFREGLGSENSRWRVRDVFTAPNGEPDILFCEEIVLA